MYRHSFGERRLATGLLSGVAIAVASTLAQSTVAQAQTAPAGEADKPTEVVITGSRIPRSDPANSSPTTVIDSQVMTERGFVQVGQALNESTAVTPSVPIRPSNGSGNTAGGGEQVPALFGLGAGRTLTLVNGRRFVSTASGFGVPGALQGSTNDSVVDTNTIPVGLLSRVEIVQGAGAAIYGSDAMAGVVNYVLRTDFEGFEVDGQYGKSGHGDYPVRNARLTWGSNFSGRGNLAVDVEWSKTDPLFNADRQRSAMGRVTSANPLDTGPNDGIPSVAEVFDARFWEFSTTGVLFAPPNPTSFPTRSFITTNNIRYNQFGGGGIPAQFSPDGQSLVAFNPGSFPSAGPSIPFSSGGDGFRYTDLGSLFAGVERRSANLIAHYDMTPATRISTELLYSKVEGEDPLTSLVSNTILNSAATGSGPITVRAANPFLSAAVRTSIINFLNANPALFGPNSGFGWAAGAPIPVSLSKVFTDALPDTTGTRHVETYRGLVSLDGKLPIASHDYNWNVFASYGISKGSIRAWDIWASRFDAAIDARASGSSIVCGINVDANPANDDPNCSPINPFGTNSVSASARNYVSALFGQDYRNVAQDYLASFGGPIVSLPAGGLDFNVAYEHRIEDASFTPTQASAAGIGRGAIPVAAQSGGYRTNEFSAEVLVPIFGGSLRYAGLESLDFSGAFRKVDNTIAGSEQVWSVGLRWRPIQDVMLRVSRSHNFRAPNLAQLLSPTSTGLEAIVTDPCDADRINGGPNPAVRLKNCQALFAAHPGYGPLASFQDPAENFPTTQVTRGGNRNLHNELSDTLSYGFIFEPSFAPGLSFAMDRIKVDLDNGLSFFTPADFLATCFDSSVQPADICAVSTRDATGAVVTSSALTFNAGSITFQGETYKLGYTFGLGSLVKSNGDLGRFDLQLEATHVTKLETSVTGVDLSRADGTTAQPNWRARFDAHYHVGPLSLTYSVSFLDEALAAQGATIENNPNPVISSNYRHSIGAQYAVTESVTLRAGIDNFTDREPSYPTLYYGDIIGRFFYLGARAKF